MIKLTMTAVLLGFTLPASATLYTQGTGVGSGIASGTVANATIADGSPIGTVNQMDLTGQSLANIGNLAVTLNLSGGYNGDLYGYLTYNGTMVVVLNRIGVSSSNPYGNSTAGMTVTFSDSASGNIHDGAGSLGSSYQADRRTVSPLGMAGTFDAAPTGSTFGGFYNANPNGVWTLFLADVVSGGGDATLLGWSLDVTPVPEPTTWALLGFGALAGAVAGARRLRSPSSAR